MSQTHRPSRWSRAYARDVAGPASSRRPRRVWERFTPRRRWPPGSGRSCRLLRPVQGLAFARVWDFADDFARVQGSLHNPGGDRYGSAGVWGYMVGSTRARPVLVQALGSPWGGLQGARGFDVWIGPDGPSTDVSFPIVGVRGVPPEGFAHPSETRSAIVAWTSPVRGRVRISGSVSDGDPRGGDGVTWVLRKGLRTLAAGTLRNGAGRRPFGVSSVDVNAGEMLYLKGHSASLERLRLDDALAADR